MSDRGAALLKERAISNWEREERRQAGLVNLWSRGSLAWKLRPEQRELKDKIEHSSTQLVVGNISRRWGKSFTLVLYCIEQAIKKRQKIRYGAAFKSDLEEFILPAFEIILADCPLSLRPTYMASKQVWKFPGGSQIKLVGLDKNRNGLRGNAINIIVIDEAGFVAHLQYQYTSVIIPATMKQTNIKILIFSTPPESPEHYFVKLIDKAQAQDNAVYMEMTIDTISDLTPEERKRQLDEVGGEESPTAQREFFCRIIVDATRAVAPSFSEKIHVKEYDPPHVKWMIFGDTGARDKTVFLKVGYDHEHGLIVFRDEYSPPNRTPTSGIVEGFRKKFPDQMPLTLDATEQLRIDYGALGLPSMAVMKDEFEAGLLLLNNSFFKNQVVIHPDCDLLIRTLKGGLLNKQRTDFERTESLGHCDAAAAAIYALRGVDRITDLRPKPSPFEVFTLNRESEFERNIKGLSWRRA